MSITSTEFTISSLDHGGKKAYLPDWDIDTYHGGVALNEDIYLLLDSK